MRLREKNQKDIVQTISEVNSVRSKAASKSPSKNSFNRTLAPKTTIKVNKGKKSKKITALRAAYIPGTNIYEAKKSVKTIKH